MKKLRIIGTAVAIAVITISFFFLIPLNNITSLLPQTQQKAYFPFQATLLNTDAPIFVPRTILGRFVVSSNPAGISVGNPVNVVAVVDDPFSAINNGSTFESVGFYSDFGFLTTAQLKNYPDLLENPNTERTIDMGFIGVGQWIGSSEIIFYQSGQSGGLILAKIANQTDEYVDYSVPSVIQVQPQISTTTYINTQIVTFFTIVVIVLTIAQLLLMLKENGDSSESRRKKSKIPHKRMFIQPSKNGDHIRAGSFHINAFKNDTDSVFGEPKSKDKFQLWWLIWGILIGFGIQVLYDGIGEYPNYSLKFWGGFSIEIIALVALSIYALVLKKKWKNWVNRG
jgi:hypothetical protein